MINNLKSILKIQTQDDVKKIIKVIQKDTKFRPVGDNDCNCGIIEINSKPISGFTERIINMQDSWLERLVLINEDTLTKKDLKSPRNLIEKVYDVKDGRLENLKDNKVMQEISDGMVVAFRDSGNEKMPTVDFRDYAIGMSPEETPNTILSLSKSGKIGKLYVIGNYGQGGSTAFSTCIYTLIVTKKYDKNGPNNRTCFTIVRYNPRNDVEYKLGVYEYLVDKKTNLPIEFECDENEFAPGTLIRHIEMDIQNYTQMITQPSGKSLWWLTHNVLFDTILPITIKDYRNEMLKDGKPLFKRIKGNYFRLANKVEVDANSDIDTVSETDSPLIYSKKEEIEFLGEKLIITIWVGNFNKKPEYVKQFVTKGTPIIVTVNGQKHAELSNKIIKTDAKLPYLYDQMIIHVNCDQLSYSVRRKMFASTRETVKENECYDELKEILVGMLKSDDNLAKLNSQRRALLSSGTNKLGLEEIADKITKKLQKSLDIKLQDIDDETTRGTQEVKGDNKPGKERGTGRKNGGTDKIEDIPVKDIPNKLVITSAKYHGVIKEENVWIKFSTNAHPDYFKKDTGKFKVDISNEKFTLISKDLDVIGGRASLGVHVSEDCIPDDVATIKISLETENGILSDTCELKVIDRRKERKNVKTKFELPKGIRIIAIDKANQYYIDNHWTDNSIAEIVFADSVDIYVSIENKLLNKMLKGFNTLGEDVKNNIQNTYIEQLTYALLEFELNIKSLDLDRDEQNIQTLIESTYEMCCKTVCSFIGDNKKIYNE